MRDDVADRVAFECRHGSPKRVRMGFFMSWAMAVPWVYGTADSCDGVGHDDRDHRPVRDRYALPRGDRVAGHVSMPRRSDYNAPMDPRLAGLTRRIAKLATHYDVTGHWPRKSLDHLTAAGAWSWVIPEQYGGLHLDPVAQLEAYEAVAAGCMSTLLILTQHDGACEFIMDARDEGLKADLLPRLARHEIMTSVGISQLTTSRQTGRPVLTATPDGDNFRLRGFMPWVTSADKCDIVVTGAVLPDDRQILAVLPTDLPGVVIDAPMRLMALEGTRTTEIHCKDVLLERRFVLRGPAERVLASRSTVKPLVVATAGIGHAGTMLRLVMIRAAKTTGQLVDLAGELAARYDAVRERLFHFADALHRPEAEVPASEIRVAVNDLLMRLAIGVLTFAKGSGLLRQRDAQRLVREALFFTVWSAPEKVRTETLARFLTEPIPAQRVMEQTGE